MSRLAASLFAGRSGRIETSRSHPSASRPTQLSAYAADQVVTIQCRLQRVPAEEPTPTYGRSYTHSNREHSLHGLVCTRPGSEVPASENQAQDDAKHANGLRPASSSSLGLHLLRLPALLNRLLPNSQGPVYVPCLALSWTKPCSGCSTSERFQPRGLRPSPGQREQPSGANLHECADDHFELHLSTHEPPIPSHSTRKA